MKIEIGGIYGIDSDWSEIMSAKEIADINEEADIVLYPPKIRNNILYTYRTQVLIIIEDNDIYPDDELIAIAQAIASHWEMDEHQAYFLLCAYGTVGNTGKSYAEWRNWD
jgi:hypothetical protein